MASTLNELRDSRNRLALEMRAIVEDQANWDAQAESRFDALDKDLTSLDRRIDALAKAQRLAAEESALRGSVVETEERKAATGASLSPEAQKRAFNAWLRGTDAELDPELRAYNRQRLAEGRAQTVGTTTAGGYLVNYEFGSGIEAARRAFGGMLSVSTVYPTQSGADLLLPTVDETGVSGSILSESSTISESAMTFGQLTVSSYMYTSGLVLVSNQLLQDSEFPLDQFIANALGERLGRAQNAHWTTGTGSSQPYGVIVGAATGKTGAAGQTTTVIYNDLVDLVYSVDVAYRPNAKWMMRDATVGIIRKLQDSQNRPLWEPSVQAGQPDMIMGYPVVINNDVAAAAASAKSIAFGDFSKYIIRDVSGVQLVRMTERYADALQTGFYAFQRTGGRLVAANTTTYNPVKLYVHPAS
jgi:HK97 family phage major capsid protein